MLGSCGWCHWLVRLRSDDHWAPGLRILLRHRLHRRYPMRLHVRSWLLLPSRSVVLLLIHWRRVISSIHRAWHGCHRAVVIAMIFPPMLWMQRDRGIVLVAGPLPVWSMHGSTKQVGARA